MMSRSLFIVAFAVLLNACGVKNDLEIPNAYPQTDSDLEDADLGNAESQNGRDPSRPPQPLGL
jgi:hypothetical protein